MRILFYFVYYSLIQVERTLIVLNHQLSSTFSNFWVSFVNYVVSKSQVEALRRPDLEAI